MNGKTVLITGTSTGFGRRLVPEFLREGWTVIATLRQAEQRADLFKDEMDSAPDRLFLFSLDVTDEQDRAAAAEFIGKHFEGQLDCLVNNAGYGLFGALEDLTEAQMRAQLEANFFGLVLLTQNYCRKSDERKDASSICHPYWVTQVCHWLPCTAPVNLRSKAFPKGFITN